MLKPGPNTRKVSSPPYLKYTCCMCGETVTTSPSTDMWADPDGPPFKAYFCRGCYVIKLLRLDEMPEVEE